MCQDLEQKHSWISCRDWYSCVVEMCENYQVTSSQYTINKFIISLSLKVQFKMKLDSLFYSLYLGSLDRLFDIQMREGAGASVCAEILHRMDQAMKDFSTVQTSPSLQVNSLF